MKLLLPYNKKDYNYLKITYYVNTECNFRCSYCHRQSENYDTKFNQNQFDTIYSQLQEIKVPFDIELLGGEVTLIPNLSELVNKLNKIAQNVSITSNGKLYKNLMDLNCELLITLHTEYITESYLSNIKKLIEYRLSKGLNIDFTTVQTSQNYEIVEKLKNFLKPYMNRGPEFDILYNEYEKIGTKFQDKTYHIFDTITKESKITGIPVDRNFNGRLCFRNNIHIKGNNFYYVCDYSPIDSIDKLSLHTPKLHKCEYKKCKVCCDDKSILFSELQN